MTENSKAMETNFIPFSLENIQKGIHSILARMDEFDAYEMHELIQSRISIDREATIKKILDDVQAIFLVENAKKRLCLDKLHDDRWCSTCNSMEDELGYLEKQFDDLKAKYAKPREGEK